MRNWELLSAGVEALVPQDVHKHIQGSFDSKVGEHHGSNDVPRFQRRHKRCNRA